MITIDQALEQYKVDTPDIRDHLDTLTELAKEVTKATEFGFRHGASFCALLKGLRDRPTSLATYDININPAHMDLFSPLRGDCELEFNQISTLDTPPIDETDLLFIDTLHNYSQLKQELELHAHKVSKYIVFHDTKTYRHVGESESGKGLYDAITEYIAGHSDWTVKFDYHYNNGLLCLEKK